MRSKKKPRQQLLWLALPGILIILAVACTSRSNLPDVTSQKVQINVMRFDQDLFQLPDNHDSIVLALENLKARYGNFFDIFNSAILNEPDSKSPIYYDVLESYLADRTIYILKQATDSVFPDLESFQSGLDRAFSYYHYYFPAMPIPRVVSFISGLNQSFITSDSLIGIALDKYLGSQSLIYAQAMMPLYQRHKMTPQRMIPDCIRAWMLTEFPAGDSVKNLLDNMIYEGRIEYLQQKLLPDFPDTLISGFSSKQLEWCKRYENRMWTYLVEKKMIFVTDAFTISKFTQEGPFTKDFSNDSPARAAVWIGMRIVESYMMHNPEVSLGQLMTNMNCYQVLEKSKYNP